jgi:hypothetical protein
MTTTVRCTFVSSLLVLACCTGCNSGEQLASMEPSGADLSTESTVDTTNAHLNPVAHLEVEPGHAVTFYEPTPGNLFLVETMLRTQTGWILRDIDQNPIEVFRRLRPRTQVPTALLDAYDRAVKNVVPDDAPTSAANPAERAGTGGRPGFALDPTSQDDSEPSPRYRTAHTIAQNGIGPSAGSNPHHFVLEHQGCSWAPVFSTCQVDWWDGYHSGLVPARSAAARVDTFFGNGVVVTLWSGNTPTDFFLPANSMTHVSWNVPQGIVNRGLQLSSALGDGFNVGVRWSNAQSIQ